MIEFPGLERDVFSAPICYFMFPMRWGGGEWSWSWCDCLMMDRLWKGPRQSWGRWTKVCLIFFTYSWERARWSNLNSHRPAVLLSLIVVVVVFLWTHANNRQGKQRLLMTAGEGGWNNSGSAHKTMRWRTLCQGVQVNVAHACLKEGRW